MADPFSDIEILVREVSTLVLGTADPQPWTAPVYCVYSEGGFAFFSSPKSRHIEASKGEVAGAIYRDGPHWRDIEGLQMRGAIDELQDRRVRETLFERYLGKFPSAREFLEEEGMMVEAWEKKFRARFYLFRPSEVHYLHNAAGLAKRTQVDWPSSQGNGSAC